MIKIRVVIDTNILVPSLYSLTPIFKFITTDNLIPLWNNFTKNEARVIIEKLAPIYIKRGIYRQEDIHRIHKLCDEILTQANYLHEMPDNWPQQSLDRHDDPFLWLAYIGNAEHIITYDRVHLLNMKEFKSIPINTPNGFFAWAKANRPIA